MYKMKQLEFDFDPKRNAPPPINMCVFSVKRYGKERVTMFQLLHAERSGWRPPIPPVPQETRCNVLFFVK